MPHSLPPLPYSYDALSPTIDELTMRMNHDRHHNSYVTNLNAALEATEWAEWPLDKLLLALDSLPEHKRSAVRASGGGHANHSMFWQTMTPVGGGYPCGALGDAICAAFESFEGLKRQVSAAATTRLGSGWVWLVHDGAGLAVTATPYEDSPLMNGHTPLLGVDVWEHAYYLKHKYRRADYVEAWWNVVDWTRVADRYATATGQNGDRERPSEGRSR